MRKWIELIVFGLILIPLSVDNFLSIPMGDYHFRIQYLGALLGWGLIAEHIFTARKSDLSDFVSNLKKWTFPFLILFWITGLIGLTQTTLFSRAVSFWIWNVFTLLSVFGIAWFYGRVKKYPLREILLHYVSIQAALIIVDSLLCIPSHGRWHLGRVMVYQSASGVNLCRPHAFYQEPGFFCAFSLLVLALFFATSKITESIKRFAWAEIGLTSLAIFLTTSRMGWLGLIVLFLGQEKIRIAVFSTLRKSNSLIRAMLAGLALAFVLIAGPAIYENVGKGLIHPTEDDSFKYRFHRTEKALIVFKASPLVGVGPGTAGAYFADHYPQDEWLNAHASTATGAREKFRRDPLSQNLFTEVLSEWGLLGFLFLSLAIFSFIRATPNLSSQLGFLAVLLVVYSSTQTLARFDLWLCLATLFVRPDEK